MNSPRRFGIRHTLDPVHTGLELQLGERAAAFDLGDDLLVSAHRAVTCSDDLGLPALAGSVALIHAEQITGEQGRLVTAGSGADFKDDVAVVHCVLRQKGDAQVLFYRSPPRFELRLFAL